METTNYISAKIRRTREEKLERIALYWEWEDREPCAKKDNKTRVKHKGKKDKKHGRKSPTNRR